MDFSNETLDLMNYEKHEKLFYNCLAKYYEIANSQTGEKYIAKIFSKTVDECSRKKLLDIYREVYINSKLKHPCLMRYIGFSSLDFKSCQKIVIVFEHTSKYTLNILLDAIRTVNIEDNLKYQILTTSKNENTYIDMKNKLNETQKLIILYGIASGMSYLHSHDIIHRNLNPSSIFFDDYFLPKISGLDFSKQIKQNLPLDEPRKDSRFKGEVKYLAPEVLSNFEYGKPSDVYSFSLIMFELMTSQKPYADLKTKSEIIENILKKKVRPKFEKKNLPCYQNFIEKCWSNDPKERPNFDEIVSELRDNTEFITNNVDKDKYHDYIKKIESSLISFDSEKEIREIDDIFRSKSNSFKLSEIDLNQRGPLNSDPVLNIQKFKINNNNKFNVCAVDKETNIKFHVDFYSKKISNFLRYEIINFARSVNICSQLNHPAIVKFVGYSPIDFDNRPYPVCITENFHNNTNFKDDTLKLIIIYGVASAMAYLHSHNILHRNLKLDVIYFDDYSLPKLYGFEIAKEINSESIEINKTIKGAPVYIAPEVYLKQGYSKASDVYSYSLILYELYTGEKPYNELQGAKEIKEKVSQEQERPKFDKPIKQCYRELIERCWSSDPKKRPTFDEILTELKTNPEFTNDIDKEKFQDYIEFLEGKENEEEEEEEEEYEFNQIPISFDTSRKIHDLDLYVKSNLHKFKELKTKINFKTIYDTETNNVNTDFNYINIRNFERVKKIGYENYSKLYTVRDKNTKKEYIAKQIIELIGRDVPDILIDISNEITNLHKVNNHPLFLKLITYSPINFKNKNSPVIFFEYASNGNLQRMIEIERQNKGDLILNDTNKLIILFGIASAMSYLHSNNIIHSLKSRGLIIQELYQIILFYLFHFYLK